jgi:hypothetical protein
VIDVVALFTVSSPCPRLRKSCTLAVLTTSAPWWVAAYAGPAFVATLAPDTTSACHPACTSSHWNGDACASTVGE